MNDPRDGRGALIRHASQLSVWIAGVAAVLPAGCGKADPRGPRVPVHGEVRLDGQPLLAGVILFHCGRHGAGGIPGQTDSAGFPEQE